MRARWMSCGLALVLVASATSGAASTESPAVESLLADAIASYEQAQSATDRASRLAAFRRAERGFDAAVAAGASTPALYTNLGNAALQGERLGPAILAYRRALALDPGDGRARQNLGHARSLLPAWVPTPATGGLLDTFFFWHHTLSRSQRVTAASIAVLLAGIGLAGAILSRSSLAAGAAALPAVAWLALVGSLALDGDPAMRDAVVVAPEVAAHASDSPNAPTLFGAPIPGGTEVEVVEDRGEWLQVQLYNGRTAWVRAAGVEAVRS